MNKKLLVEIRSLVKDKQSWDAFLALIAYEESKVVLKLKGPKSSDELIRINAEFTLLQHFKNIREICLNAEREFNAPE